MAYPTSPTNGQVYGNKKYNSTKVAWEEQENSVIKVSGGSVLIGTTTDAPGRLQVFHTIDNDGIRIATSGSGAGILKGPNIYLDDGTSNNTNAIQATGGALQFWNYGSGSWLERMRITSDGNVLIGTASSLIDGLNVAATGSSGWVSAFMNPTKTVGVLAGYRGSTGMIGTVSATNLSINPDGGNVQIGGPSDTGAKLQVNGSIAINNVKTMCYTHDTWVGGGILTSCFGDVATAGELYVTEIGTNKYLNATFFKQNTAATAVVTITASNGLELGASNNGGTQNIASYTNGSNIRMISVIRALY